MSVLEAGLFTVPIHIKTALIIKLINFSRKTRILEEFIVS
jgi:hypothetical protein